MTVSPVFLAIALSLVSALCYATAAVVQERTAADTPSVRGALTHGSWWWSVALNAGGALLHVVALRYGPLTLVQPLGALSLVVAVPLGSWATGRRTPAGQWRAMALTLAGLTALMTVTASGRGPGDTLGSAEMLLVTLAATAVVALLVRAATHRSTLSGLTFAAASGIASGVGSTLAQKLAVGPTLSWSAAYVAVLTVAFAVSGLLLSQQAYRSGLGGPLALLTLLNPVTASAIGITLLGEGFRYGGTGPLLALAGATAAVRGVILLSRSQPRQGRPRVPHGRAPGTVADPRPARTGRSQTPATGPSRLVTVDFTRTGRAI
ncbi:DMT family transporter [Streptomyces cellulosae]|uniref:DMT family transporter n=1 Tax=Streptomyces cellulosae TaxID=1968 RepID=A0ABW7XZB4_STRCE